MKQSIFYALAIGSLLLCAPVANAQTTYTGGTGGSLVDATTVVGEFTSDLVVNAPGTTVSTFNSVTITGFTHTWMGDLQVLLTKVETGEIISLFAPPDDESTNLGGDYTFFVNPSLQTMDQAASALTGAQAIPTGSYAASFYGGGTALGPRSTFTDFDGVALSGTWQLSINDFATGDTGAITGWRFSTFTNAVAVPEPTTFALMGAAGLFGIVLRKRRK